MPQEQDEAAGDDIEQAAFALMEAARALVAVAARSLDDLRDDVTFPQYRALVVLATRGPRNVSALAVAIGVHQSTASRLAERLLDLGLLERANSPVGGREVLLGLSGEGRQLTDELRRRRHDELARIVERMDGRQRQLVVQGLTAFAQAAQEEPEQFWPQGWAL